MVFQGDLAVECLAPDIEHYRSLSPSSFCCQPTSPSNRLVMCNEIDDGLVELYALGGLPDAIQELITHLEERENVQAACRRGQTTG
jgi:hypothetical protein